MSLNFLEGTSLILLVIYSSGSAISSSGLSLTVTFPREGKDRGWGVAQQHRPCLGFVKLLVGPPTLKKKDV